MSHRQIIDNIVKVSGCGSVWLEYLVWDQGVAGSNPVTPTLFYRLRMLVNTAFRAFLLFEKTVSFRDFAVSFEVIRELRFISQI